MDGNSPQNQTAAPSQDGVPGNTIGNIATPTLGEPPISISDSTRPTTVLGVPSNLISISQYKALRVAPIAAPANLTPDAPSLAAMVADNQHMAVAQMRTSLAGGINLAVVPPLTYAVVRSLGSTAFGDSLTQISRNFDLTPAPFVAAQQTAWVSSHLWADREKKNCAPNFCRTPIVWARYQGCLDGQPMKPGFPMGARQMTALLRGHCPTQTACRSRGSVPKPTYGC